VVQSLHKTLPSLTQTAILHRMGARVPQAALRHAVGVFQSTSPSYLFLASMDGCVSFLRERGAASLAAWRARLDRFYREMTGLRHLRLLNGNFDNIYAHDPGKLTILTGGTNLRGTALMAALRSDFGIELEMALDGYAVAMTSLASTDEDFARLGAALRASDETCTPSPAQTPIALPPMPEQVMPAGEALRLPGRREAFAESVGEISRAYVWAYPPGVPIVTPGVRVTRDIADALAQLAARGVKLDSTFGAAQGFLEVVDNPVKIG